MADRQAVTWPDIALTAALLLVGLNGTGPAAANQGTTVPVAGYVLVVAACLPIAIWRWRPLWALVGSGAATALYLGLGYAYGPIMFPLVVATYGYAVRAPLRRTVIATGLLAGGAVVALAVEVVAGARGWAELVTGAAWVAAWLVIPAAVGVVVKVRRDAAAEVRAEQARRGVSEERLRLAQEVHDVVGHSLAVIAMQAGVVLRVLDRDPHQARQAVETIRSTSTEALDGLRAELDTLRHGPARAEAPRRPGTGLADLPDLVARFRDSGLPVSVERAGTGLADLPADVDHAAYRVVQEALTNVLRHGGPQAAARARLVRDGEAMQVEVTNTGAAAAPGTEPTVASGTAAAAAPGTGPTVTPGTGATAAPGSGGHGITGMRERAEALGGTLEAGPQPGGGFAVRARLPLTGARRREGGA